MLQRIFSYLSDRKKGAEQPAGPAATPLHRRVEEIEERLLEDSIIFLGTPIDEEVGNRVIAKLLFLEAERPEKEVSLYINSPGGSIVGSMAIHDTIKSLAIDVTTVCLGQAAGTAALLVACGQRGKRFAVRGSQFQLMPLSGGPASDRSQLERARSVIARALSGSLHRSRRQIRLDLEHGLVLNAEEAVGYGFIDRVIERDEVRL